MRDGQGRLIDYLRVSVTDRCNLRCLYCMPARGVEWIPHDEILSYEEIGRLVGIFAGLGIRKIKLTGGEPLARRGLESLVRRLAAIPGIETITLTTNGLLLAEELPALAAAGISGINISVDAAEEEIYQRITGRTGAAKALAAMDQALAIPGMNVKLNCVPLGINDSQLPLLAALAKERPIAVRFIELMPIGIGRELAGRPEKRTREILESAHGPLREAAGPEGNGPCRYFSLPGFRGKIGLISAISHQFCDSCNRARLTSGGFLKTCLQYDRGADLRALLRTGASDEELAEAIRAAILAKPAAHHFRDGQGERDLEKRLMSRIGG